MEVIGALFPDRLEARSFLTWGDPAKIRALRALYHQCRSGGVKPSTVHLGNQPFGFVTTTGREQIILQGQGLLVEVGIGTDVRARTMGGRPQLKILFGSDVTRDNGVRGCLELQDELAHELGFVAGHEVSRIDVAADVLGGRVSPEIVELTQCSRASKAHYLEAKVFGSGASTTGVTFGRRGSPVYVRLYDKLREARGRPEVYERWARAGVSASAADAEGVLRAEVEVRTERLKQIGCSAAPEYFAKDVPGVVWAHVMGTPESDGWMTIRSSTGHSNLSRRPRSELHKLLVQAGTEVESPQKMEVEKDTSQLWKQAVGCAFSAQIAENASFVSEQHLLDALCARFRSEAKEALKCGKLDKKTALSGRCSWPSPRPPVVERGSN